MSTLPPVVHKDQKTRGRDGLGGPWAPFPQTVARVGESSRMAGWAECKGR